MIAAISEGVHASWQRGMLLHYPLEGVQVSIIDGSYDLLASTPSAFRICALEAVGIAVKAAVPCLLEPMMSVEVRNMLISSYT